LARDVKNASIVLTVVFVLFGNEEMIDSNPDHHHYGSRAYIKGMTATDRDATVAMISLDMGGYGSTFTVRTTGRGPRDLRDMIEDFAAANGVAIKYLMDPSN
jgi:Zn-dependent M28 family amino/carboxypeptidase